MYWIASHNVLPENWFSFFKVKATLRAHLIKLWLFLQCLLNWYYWKVTVKPGSKLHWISVNPRLSAPLISLQSKTKQKSAGREWMVKHSPQILSSEEKATTTHRHWCTITNNQTNMKKWACIDSKTWTDSSTMLTLGVFCHSRWQTFFLFCSFLERKKTESREEGRKNREISFALFAHVNKCECVMNSVRLVVAKTLMLQFYLT